MHKSDLKKLHKITLQFLSLLKNKKKFLEKCLFRRLN